MDRFRFSEDSASVNVARVVVNPSRTERSAWSVGRQGMRVDLLVQYAAEIAQSLGEQNVPEGE
jgi:cob(I)alamin adenosyltransferase